MRLYKSVTKILSKESTSERHLKCHSPPQGSSAIMKSNAEWMQENKSLYIFERTIYLKWKFCHHLLTFELFQTCMSFLLLLNTKEDILKNIGYHLPDSWMGNKYIMEVNGAHELWHYSKYRLLCSAEERNSYRLTDIYIFSSVVWKGFYL